MDFSSGPSDSRIFSLPNSVHLLRTWSKYNPCEAATPEGDSDLGFVLVLSSLFTPKPSSKEKETLVSGKEKKQKPGLQVSGPLCTREMPLIGFHSAGLERPADICLVVEGMTKSWVRGSLEWPAARAAGI